MEFKELEYFVTVSDKKSFTEAAECLFTSQSSVSKVIGKLETSLGRKLFDRTNRGIKLTRFGQCLYTEAKIILKRVYAIKKRSQENASKPYSIASYYSVILSKILIDFYMEDKIHLDHRQGKIADVINFVSQGLSEIGIIYLAKSKLNILKHILGHHDLAYEELAVRDCILHVGEKNPYYNKEIIDYKDLSKTKFIGEVSDYFVVGSHLGQYDLGIIEEKNMDIRVFSNSNQLVVDLISKSELASLEINFYPNTYRNTLINSLKISGFENSLSLGYIFDNSRKLSRNSQNLLKKISETLA